MSKVSDAFTVIRYIWAVGKILLAFSHSLYPVNLAVNRWSFPGQFQDEIRLSDLPCLA